MITRIPPSIPAARQINGHVNVYRRYRRWSRMFRTAISVPYYLVIGVTVFLGVFGLTSMALAHTPLMACFDNGDGTITCNGGFSDGSSASGVAVRVIDERESIIIQGTMDRDGEYTFDRPGGRFTVVFDAGPGHVVKERSDNIE